VAQSLCGLVMTTLILEVSEYHCHPIFCDNDLS
jgi:hypothetical protein